MKLVTLIAAAGLIGALCTFSSAANAMSTQDFVTDASVANIFEIESSKLALTRSQNSDVKAFAQQMIDDHTKVGDQLEKALQTSQSGAQASQALDSKHQKMLDELKSASADDFDDKYIKMQTKAHKKAVKLFTHYAKHGDDAALKSFAAQTLPTLQAHLDHVKQLKSNM